VTLGAVALEVEGLAVLGMAGKAVLTGLVGRRNLCGALLHLEDLGVAVVALETRIGVGLSGESYYSHGALIERQGLSRRHCEGSAGDEGYAQHENDEQSNLFHFTPPFNMVCMTIARQKHTIVG
jgi:hypothetical protein